MRLKIANPNDKNWGKEYKYYINATHTWSLPGVKCSVCKSTWSVIGVAYPCVTITDSILAEKLKKPQPISEFEFTELIKEIVPLFSGDFFLPPGTEFGPLEGKAWGIFGDFAWLNPWTILVQNETYGRLAEAGIKLPKVVSHNLRFRAKNFPELLEFQIEPLARLSQSSYSVAEPARCHACGRETRSATRIIIDQNSIPEHVDLFRIRDLPTFIVAKERLFEICEEENLKDILFSEIDGYE